MLKPSEALAKNIRAARGWNGMKQSELAARMTELGHKWSYTTVSQIEAMRRRVDVDELFTLALALRTSPSDLLTPKDTELEVGGFGLAPSLIAAWMQGKAVHLRSGGLAAFVPDENEGER